MVKIKIQLIDITKIIGNIFYYKFSEMLCLTIQIRHYLMKYALISIHFQKSEHCLKSTSKFCFILLTYLSQRFLQRVFWRFIFITTIMCNIKSGI